MDNLNGEEFTGVNVRYERGADQDLDNVRVQYY